MLSMAVENPLVIAPKNFFPSPELLVLLKYTLFTTKQTYQCDKNCL